MKRYVTTKLTSNQGIQPTERRARVFLIRIVVALLLIVPLAAIRAQERAMDGAAAQTADSLSKSKQTSIVVFDFVGPDGKMTALGQKLADDFSQALSQSGHNLHVENRSRIAEVVSKGQYASDVIDIPTLDVTLAYDMKVKAFVSGTISVEGQDVNVLVKSTRVKDSRKIASFSFSLALTEELAASLGKIIADAPVPAYLDVDDKRDSPPHCVSCPRAEYSSEAIDKKAQGTVILEAVVSANGAISDIRVIKPMPFELTAAAIQAVHSWRLSPATGLDGKPIAVRQIFQVSFLLR